MRPVTLQIGELSGTDFVSLTTEQRADEIVHEVWRTYDSARWKIVATDPDRIISASLLPVSAVASAAAWLASWWSDAGEARTTAKGAIESMRPLIEKWATDRRTWAFTTARTPSGQVYTADEWVTEGKVYVDSINEIYDIGSDYSLFQNIGNAASDTAVDIKEGVVDAAEKVVDATAFWFKLTIAGVVLIGAAYAYNTFSPDVRRAYGATRKAYGEAKSTVRKYLPPPRKQVAGLRKRKKRRAARRR